MLHAVNVPSAEPTGMPSPLRQSTPARADKMPLENVSEENTKEKKPETGVEDITYTETIDLTCSPPISASKPLIPPCTASSSTRKSRKGLLSEYQYLRPRRQTRAMTKKRKLSDDDWDDVFEIEKLLAATADN